MLSRVVRSVSRVPLRLVARSCASRALPVSTIRHSSSVVESLKSAASAQLEQHTDEASQIQRDIDNFVDELGMEVTGPNEHKDVTATYTINDHTIELTFNLMPEMVERENVEAPYEEQNEEQEQRDVSDNENETEQSHEEEAPVERHWFEVAITNQKTEAGEPLRLRCFADSDFEISVEEITFGGYQRALVNRDVTHMSAAEVQQYESKLAERKYMPFVDFSDETREAIFNYLAELRVDNNLAGFVHSCALNNRMKDVVKFSQQLIKFLDKSSY